MFKIKIETANDAFHADYGMGPRFEVARILRIAADKLERGMEDGPLLDANGNMVGMFGFGPTVAD